MSDQHKQILKNHSLRITDCRLDVIDYFLSNKNALSQGDLEQRLKQYDRVTLYRTLNSFLESGILHKIPNESGTATYGMCYDTCGPHDHNHNHVHFKCNSCGQIQCLDEEQMIPTVALPKGYEAEGANLIIDGKCDECA